MRSKATKIIISWEAAPPGEISAACSRTTYRGCTSSRKATTTRRRSTAGACPTSCCSTRRTARFAAKPFFAFIQTAGNHRPYSIPGDHPGFELAQVDAAALAQNGFDGLAAYNGLRYLDFSLGAFFAKAREAPYFKNTVFVMYGDHGNPSTRQTPWEQLLLTSYHVPCVIYAPGLVKEIGRAS